VVDAVDRAIDCDELRDVLVLELEVLVADVLDVVERAGVEVVDADHPMALPEQELA
jgi:hypothetical protein